ncbi:MAG: polysaccharide pyruvyl transferase family protein [Colwellia sp.]|jgi:Polysaccharide pyruvyl transferase.
MIASKAKFKKVKTSYFKIKTQFDNVGDALINRELIKLCASMGGVVVDISSCPSSFQNWLGLNKIKNVISIFSAFSFWCRIVIDLLKKNEVYFFINPGGYIGEISRLKAYVRITKCLWLGFLRFCGVKICLVGVSYEKLGANNLLSIKARAKILYFHGVRDSISEVLCSTEGIKTHRIEDLAFGCDYIPKINTDNSSVLVSMRQDDDIDIIVNSLFTNLNIEYQDIFLSSQVKRDMATQEDIKNKLSVDVSDLGMVDGVDSALERYSNVKYVISNRLHVLLLAWFAGAIPIALIASNKNQKIRGIFSDLEMNENIIEYNCSKEIISDTNLINSLKFTPVNPKVKDTLINNFSRIFSSEEV